jgi:hypothetical protein
VVDKALVSSKAVEALFERDKLMTLALQDCIRELKIARGDVRQPDHLHPASALIARVRALVGPDQAGA